MSPVATTVPGDTLLTVPPVNKTVMEGDTVTFDCVAKGERTAVNWLREGVSIPEIQVKIHSIFLSQILKRLGLKLIIATGS